MNVNELIEVTPEYEPTTMLQSALAALDRVDGNISPLQEEDLILHISDLERKAAKDGTTIDYLSELLSILEPAYPCYEAR